MVVVVTDAILEASRRPRRLNAADQAFGDQQRERVVDRLKGDRADFGPNDVGDGIGGDMRLSRYRAEYREALRSDLDAALTEEICRLGTHSGRIDQKLD